MKNQCERSLRDAQEEAERYREKAERLQRQERERDEERERQREEDRKRRDPSNRLYHGDVSSFAEAVRLRIACLTREIVPPESDLDEKCNKSMREGIAEANAARKIYEEATKAAMAKAVADLDAAGLTDWAEALASGDYSGLAV